MLFCEQLPVWDVYCTRKVTFSFFVKTTFRVGTKGGDTLLSWKNQHFHFFEVFWMFLNFLGCYRVLPKKTLIFDWTVLEDQEELEAVLWTRFRVVFLGSEIVWKLSENVSCLRTSERAEKPWFQKRGPPTFFLHRHVWAKKVTFSVSRLPH